MNYNLIKDQDILVSMAYLPPVSYLKAIVNSRSCTIEQNENYLKQSYRNRCLIYAANGVMSLSIPVELATNKKILIKDVKIEYRESWQKNHLKSIKSAYGTSPYYDFLVDDFISYFTKEIKFLIDFNIGLLNVIFDILQIEKQILFSESYLHNPGHIQDYRNYFSPKKVHPEFSKFKPYPQVFSQKFGFQSDLSCIDLIFNLGSDAYSYLIDRY